jgi:hypothetical protein
LPLLRERSTSSMIPSSMRGWSPAGVFIVAVVCVEA